MVASWMKSALVQGIGRRLLSRRATAGARARSRNRAPVSARFCGASAAITSTNSCRDESRLISSRLIVGSEGTLALVLDATLRLITPPKHRAMCVVQFHDLLESLEATPVILQHKPSAVELVDRFILDSTRGKTEFEPLRDFIVGDPAAVLFVEFMSDEPSEPAARVAELESGLKSSGYGYHVHRRLSPRRRRGCGSCGKRRWGSRWRNTVTRRRFRSSKTRLSRRIDLRDYIAALPAGSRRA